MLTGGQTKTTSHIITYWWPTASDAFDFRMGNQVGAYIGKAEKGLNKKTHVQVCKLLAEQFPELVEIESRDTMGRLARWTK